jgi:tryptophanyl-tRNA synthetase
VRATGAHSRASSPASPPPARPHLGNYVGAIRPAVVASRARQCESFFFLADYHALIKCDDPARMQRSRWRSPPPGWPAAWTRTRDLLPAVRHPEIPELTWLLTCVTGKGLLNRAHAYKAAVDKNVAPARTPMPASPWACSCTRC